jgi:hypothetical protein
MIGKQHTGYLRIRQALTDHIVIVNANGREKRQKKIGEKNYLPKSENQQTNNKEDFEVQRQYAMMFNLFKTTYLCTTNRLQLNTEARMKWY